MLVPNLDPAAPPQLEMTADKAREMRTHLEAIARFIPTKDKP
jgi:hypothetical protein